MTQTSKAAGGGRDVPRVLYTYANKEGDRCALAIRDDLDTVPNPLSAKPLLYAPQTPEKVRTHYYNSIAKIISYNDDPGLMAERVLLHQLPNGDTFLEVQLTPEGQHYLEQYHTEYYAWYDYEEFYRRYVPHMPHAKKHFERDFSPRLKEALKRLGMAPKAKR